MPNQRFSYDQSESIVKDSPLTKNLSYFNSESPITLTEESIINKKMPLVRAVEQDLRDESSALIQSPTNHSTTIMNTTLADSVASSAILINHQQKEQAPSSSIMLNTSISPITLTEESISKTMQLVPVIGARRGKLTKTKTKTNNHTIHSQFEDEEDFEDYFLRMDDEEDETTPRHRLQSLTSSSTQNEDQLKDHDLTIAKKVISELRRSSVSERRSQE
jgi:hypothetical protein